MTQVKPEGSIFDDTRKQIQHTSGELIALADHAASLGLEKAELKYLFDAKESLDPDDPRYASIENRVETLHTTHLEDQLVGEVMKVQLGGGINSEAAPLRDTP